MVSGLEPRQPGGRAYAGAQCTVCPRWRAHVDLGPQQQSPNSLRAPLLHLGPPPTLLTAPLACPKHYHSILLGEERGQDLGLDNPGLDPSPTIY